MIALPDANVLAAATAGLAAAAATFATTCEFCTIGCTAADNVTPAEWMTGRGAEGGATVGAKTTALAVRAATPAVSIERIEISMSTPSRVGPSDDERTRQ
jgi:hypothetical protein